MIRLLRLARPHFLFASFLLYSLGCLWAVLHGEAWSISRFLLGYLVILPAHLSVSFSNDYFDMAVDAHGSPTAFSGGSGVLVSHPELRNTARSIAIGLICLSLVLALLFWWSIRLPGSFVAMITACNLIGWFYAAPPLRFAYHGWGEISTASIAGLLPAMGYVAIRGEMDLDGLLLAFPLVLYGMAFILTVEIPDVEADRLGNKRTWLVRMGRNWGFLAVACCLLVSTAFFFCLPWFSAKALPVNTQVLVGLSLCPLVASLIGAAVRPAHQSEATKLANLMVVSLAAFFMLMNGYFFFSVLR